ncbi:rod shape-determining protein rodA [Lacticaseibacillus saniviri JCM 17471 = DSM 24301]|uniref:Rod shape-determining protein rodA n=2 Tax=Lacticaseibacillus saniviri TaxID=931533 RepID=A0A0R2N0T8_9LACO|nr:rod shape-determining protein rodA [Lacticaseibacillus saniviri JCM 17471 = DSM 24301]
MAKELNAEEPTSRLDYGIILSVMLLALVGMAAIYMSIVHAGTASPMRALIMQAVWYIIGGVGIAIVIQFDAEQLWRIAPVLYGIGIFLLIAVLFLYDRNVAASTGAKSWFKFGPITFQPSEVMKPAYILMLGRAVTQHNTEYQHSVKNDWRLLGTMLLWTLPVVALMLLQKDLGTTLVFLAIFSGVVLVSGITWKIIAPVAGVAAAVGGSAILLVTQSWGRQLLSTVGFKAYQFARIDSWLNPSGNTTGDSFQLWQSMKAIGSGQLTGKGFNHLQVVVPVQESDMVFSAIGEAFGFIGAAGLILLYFLLIYQMIRVIFDTKNEFYAYITTGVIMMIVFHVFENIGMNIGLLPLTGIPLPFISQGGSFLLANMLSVGLVLSMRYHHTSYMFSQEQEGFQ